MKIVRYIISVFLLQGSSGLNTVYSLVNNTGLAVAGAAFLGLGGRALVGTV
jgi:hypothetical protein